MSPQFEFDRVDGFVVGTVGEPGARTFYLQARVGNAVTSFKMEKEQVAMLGRYLAQVVGTMGGAAPDRDVAGLVEPVEPQWAVGTLSALVDEDARTVQITAEELLLDEDLDELEETFDPGLPDDLDDPDEELGYAEDDELVEQLEELLGIRGRTAEFTLTLGQAMAFAEQAEELVAAGRRPCRLCGRPMEPDGHDCPRWN
ncbi:MAG: DUF3090 family protein [Actinomycetes bacterium]